jgi:hypothetical protein
MSAVRIERPAHPVPLCGVSADQRGYVVRDRIELSTFRFSGALSSESIHLGKDANSRAHAHRRC